MLDILVLLKDVHMYRRLRHGFKLGCHEVIGLDGTHIKNFYNGQTLTTTGVDMNDYIYSITYVTLYLMSNLSPIIWSSLRQRVSKLMISLLLYQHIISIDQTSIQLTIMTFL